MDWLLLIIAGVFEIIWATGLKYTEGFTRLWASMGTLAAMAVSMVLVSAGVEDHSRGNRLCHMDRNRCGGNSRHGNRAFRGIAPCTAVAVHRAYHSRHRRIKIQLRTVMEIHY